MIKFNCPICNQAFKVDDTLGGTRGKCPGCGEKVLVPLSSEIKSKKDSLPWEDGFDFSESKPSDSSPTAPPKQSNAVPIISKSSFENPEHPPINQSESAQAVSMFSTGCGCLVIGLASVLLFAVMNRGGNQQEARIPQESNKTSAWVMAEQFVKERLKSPSTASFGSVFGEHQDIETCVTALGNREFEVKGWVDSQNSFGATVRANFFVRIRDEGNGQWLLIGEPILIQR